MALTFLGQHILSEDGANEGIGAKNRVFATQAHKDCSRTNDAGYTRKADASDGGQNYLSQKHKNRTYWHRIGRIVRDQS